MTVEIDIVEGLLRRWEPAALRGLPMSALQRQLGALLGWTGRGDADPDGAVAALLDLAGVDDAALLAAERRLSHGLERVAQLGVDADDLGVVGQAYIRAVGRVVAAEAEIISALLAGLAEEPDDSTTRREALVELAGRLGRDMFDVLHAAMLSKALSRESSPFGKREATDDPVAVAHVDVVGSTALLVNASHEETSRLVDGLFSSAQSAIRGRSVEATKYVGDGVFLAGSDPSAVAQASLACLESLRGQFAITARAGLAYGPVVHRAGDLFGLPVNLAHILTKAARPGMLLASSAAAAVLPSEMLGEARQLEVPALGAPIEALEVLPAG